MLAMKGEAISKVAGASQEVASEDEGSRSWADLYTQQSQGDVHKDILCGLALHWEIFQASFLYIMHCNNRYYES